MKTRLRRLRRNPMIRDLISETVLSRQDLIHPIFVVEGENQKQAIDSMPGVFRYSVDRLEEEIAEIKAAGIQSVLLFGIPEKKDWCGSEASVDDIKQAVRLKLGKKS